MLELVSDHIGVIHHDSMAFTIYVSIERSAPQFVRTVNLYRTLPHLRGVSLIFAQT